MKPVLIFFYGDADTGKTNVLKKLGEWFHYRCTEYIELRDVARSADSKLSIKYREHSCRVGIGTSGDNIDIVMENINFFLDVRYFGGEEFCVFVTASRYEHSDKTYQQNVQMKNLLTKFTCIDIPRNLARKSRTRKNGAVRLVREDDLFVYIQTIIKTRKANNFSC